ncbi:acyl-CoA synthetase [Iamia sp. SCSIO 61187]|uniref:acyl-CoA synthetase n=1 Tax=Iamia sp. SCSIO 61187 TaxID=2722752 RepID=UPI001C6371FA|nr:acyl-CoA synthetase [Iamia sp. SCSIO 61187]QYG94140.1 acyl-CoA synthetase [Iamia sp. SCSIO 61187]
MADAPASFNLADIWEWAAARGPDRLALVVGPERRTYGELDARADRIAHHLRAAGIGPGDRVAIDLRNAPEYLEVMIAAFKLRAIPVNVNFRYVAGELRYVLETSRAAALVYHRSLADAVAGVPDVVGSMRAVLAVDDIDGSPPAEADVAGAVPYADALDAAPDGPVVTEGRSGDDHYLMFTGGTTGLPKGVLWRHEDAFYACLGGGDPMRLSGPITDLAEMGDRFVEKLVYMPIAPLMHAAAQWTSFMWFFGGGTVVLVPGSFDAEAAWDLVAREGVNVLTVVGDAVAKPLLDARDAHPDRWDVSSLYAIGNGAAPLSSSVRARLVAAFPGCVITDGMGSSESGVQGAARTQPGEGESGAASAGGVASFTVGPTTTVLDASLQPVEPGSGEVGRLATSGRIPIGYDGDPAKTAETFVEVDGVRWVLSGDMCTVDADGTVRLLGRGSQCINTGGEKVYPEEVEGVLHGHPAVADVLVVGVDDERWGSAVTAVVQPAEGVEPPTLDDLRDHARTHLAGYKLPKHLVVVDRVQRTPAGKADYRWAASAARTAVAPTP